MYELGTLSLTRPLQRIVRRRNDRKCTRARLWGLSNARDLAVGEAISIKRGGTGWSRANVVFCDHGTRYFAMS